jgi:trehalose-phosphatase
VGKRIFGTNGDDPARRIHINPSLDLKKFSYQLHTGRPLWLFLDYDGTLVSIAPKPDQALPDAALLDLLSKIAQIKTIRVAIVSGRPLVSLRLIFPVSPIILVGIYGVEIQMDGQTITRVADPIQTRQKIDAVKSEWAQIISGHDEIWIEDKGLALAMHARFAKANLADAVLSQARRVVEKVDRVDYRIFSGERFLEIAPASAGKGQAVTWLLEHVPMARALPIYFGDDDKDAEAFAIIHTRGGIAIQVGARQLQTRVDARLSSPDETRHWLDMILIQYDSAAVT